MKRVTGFIINTFLNSNIINIISKTIPPVIRCDNHVQQIIVSSHATNADDKKNNAQADKTIATHTTTIAAHKIVSFSSAVNLR